SGRAVARRGSRRSRPGIAGRGCAQEDRRDDGLPRRGEGELSADAREDAVHPRRAAAHGVLVGLPARPPGGAADHEARSREELPEDLAMAVVQSIEAEFRRYKTLGEQAIAQLDGAALSAAPPGAGNSIATICWHVSGNFRSRFT